jgi:type I restriction enzyme M protein
MNWGNAAIGKINSVLHGLEAEIKAGASTITDPQFLEDGKVRKFSLVLANFPFSDDFWWLKPEQQTDDVRKKDKLKKEIFGKEGFKDTFGRFGRGTGFQAPPAGYGDYAFILHILASLTDDGRAGIVCPQGVLFRGQPEVEEESEELDGNGIPKVKRRKADDEHLIRKALLESRLIDAVISLPLNVFYGAGVPACLLILRKQRPAERHDKVLLVYAARHFRELSAQNELRPQDVMRMLVHVHAYGDAAKVPLLVDEHAGRIHGLIDSREEEEVGRIEAEYQAPVNKLAALDTEVAEARRNELAAETKQDKAKFAGVAAKLEKQREKFAAKLVERDARIVEGRRRAEDDRRDVAAVGDELVTLYGDPDGLLKHARVVGLDEVEENEFNLNIPRYVDTFEPEPRVEVKDALNALREAEAEVTTAKAELSRLLRSAGYAE